MSSSDRYAVFGNPIAHSKSPMLHKAFAKQTQQDIEYTAQCVELECFNQTVDEFFASGGKGLNITLPFKIAAFNYAHALTPRAQQAGAVNTLIKKDHVIMGDNTDGVGLINDILHNLSWQLADKKILVLGAGGAVRGVIGPLLNTQPTRLVIANRTPEKAQHLVKSFSHNDGRNNIIACELDQLEGPFDIIINGTSISLTETTIDLPSGLLHHNTGCYDMMYSKHNTLFLDWAAQQGAKAIADGLGMLICQGAESFYLWRDIRPEVKPVITEVRQAL